MFLHIFKVPVKEFLYLQDLLSTSPVSKSFSKSEGQAVEHSVPYLTLRFFIWIFQTFICNFCRVVDSILWNLFVQDNSGRSVNQVHPIVLKWPFLKCVYQHSTSATRPQILQHTKLDNIANLQFYKHRYLLTVPLISWSIRWFARWRKARRTLSKWQIQAMVGPHDLPECLRIQRLPWRLVSSLEIALRWKFRQRYTSNSPEYCLGFETVVRPYEEPRSKSESWSTCQKASTVFHLWDPYLRFRSRDWTATLYLNKC